ncbi:MAG: ARPP-1 family domain-containing protein [Planctomycetota bacterium]|jgi:hypothetical protein
MSFATRIIVVALTFFASVSCLGPDSRETGGSPFAPREEDKSGKVDAGEYRVSGPYTFKNLSLYLVHGFDRMEGKDFITLEEAMDKKYVVVHETDNVRQLAIENISDKNVFIQSGDIVKGGKQDRILRVDVILPAESGKVPIQSFCVERGRWSRRGKESTRKFSSSKNRYSHKSLKLATRRGRAVSRGQTAAGGQSVTISEGTNSPGAIVQREGERFADFLRRSQTAAGGQRATIAEGSPRGQTATRGQGAVVRIDPNSTGGQRVTMADRYFSRGPSQSAAWGAVRRGQTAMIRNMGDPLACSRSPSSMQLTLEHPVVRAKVEEYEKALLHVVKGKDGVIGYAFAVNGELSCADVYGCRELFSKLWKKLFRSTAVEALSSLSEWKEGTAEPPAAEIADFLLDAEMTQPLFIRITDRTELLVRETDETLLFEARDTRNEGEWIYRNYLTKEEVPDQDLPEERPVRRRDRPNRR